jgi:pilus assembly protein Flp/PilA
MSSLVKKVSDFIRDEEGLTTVEYAIAGSLVGLAVVTSFDNLGDAVGAVIDQITTDIGGTPG